MPSKLLTIAAAVALAMLASAGSSRPEFEVDKTGGPGSVLISSYQIPIRLASKALARLSARLPA